MVFDLNVEGMSGIPLITMLDIHQCVDGLVE